MKTLPGRARYLALCREFDRYDGWCDQCSRRFRAPTNWWHHLRDKHPDTVRTNVVLTAIETAS